MPILGKHGGSTAWSFDQSLGVEFGAYCKRPAAPGGLGPTFARRDNRLPAPKNFWLSLPKADMSDLSHSNQAPPLASRGDLHAKGNNCKHRPTAMKKNSRSYHQAAGDRANGSALQNIGEAS